MQLQFSERSSRGSLVHIGGPQPPAGKQVTGVPVPGEGLKTNPGTTPIGLTPTTPGVGAMTGTGPDPVGDLPTRDAVDLVHRIMNSFRAFKMRPAGGPLLP